MTRRQTAILDAVRKLRDLNQRSGAAQIAAATGMNRETVRRECVRLVADGHLDTTDRGSLQAGRDYTIPETP